MGTLVRKRMSGSVRKGRIRSVWVQNNINNKKKLKRNQINNQLEKKCKQKPEMLEGHVEKEKTPKVQK